MVSVRKGGLAMHTIEPLISENTAFFIRNREESTLAKVKKVILLL
jgi:hypothetical protein